MAYENDLALLIQFYVFVAKYAQSLYTCSSVLTAYMVYQYDVHQLSYSVDVFLLVSSLQFRTIGILNSALPFSPLSLQVYFYLGTNNSRLLISEEITIFPFMLAWKGKRQHVRKLNLDLRNLQKEWRRNGSYNNRSRFFNFNNLVNLLMNGLGLHFLQQLEMLKYMRNFHLDDQLAILEKVWNLWLCNFSFILVLQLYSCFARNLFYE